MQKKSLTIFLAILVSLAIIMGIVMANKNKPEREQHQNFKIVTSFYPIYVMTASITEGAHNIELVNMTETNVGCLHDYTLTTNDMKKIEKANVIVENGLKLESFNDKIISAYPKLTVIDSSIGVQNTINEDDEVNPHIWTSLDNYMSQVKVITEKLSLANEENAELYQQNSKEYLKRLKELKTQYEANLQNVKGKKAICLNEALAYLADEVGLNAIVIETDHEESTLSAETLKNLIQMMKQEDMQMILVDKEDSLKNAQTLANETGAKIVALDSGLTGNFTKDAYLNAMKENLNILQQL
ncbi:MAG: zinc ABC transporter substrate-binding protein [Clostridia bacterium]|nr:zinc ABC transporter substrate-binding protein [Clostridia bacterium]